MDKNLGKRLGKMFGTDMEERKRKLKEAAKKIKKRRSLNKLKSKKEDKY